LGVKGRYQEIPAEKSVIPPLILPVKPISSIQAGEACKPGILFLQAFGAGGWLDRGAAMRQSKQLLPERAEDTWEDADNRVAENHIMEARKVTIKLEDGALIQGKINLLSEPARDFGGLYDKHLEDQGTYYRRISDIFTKGKNPFIVVFDALMENEAGKVLIINKNKILWVVPED
jgi:hypothetical protein